MDALGLPAANVAGHSMGGRVAQWMALDHPARIRTLILAASGPGQFRDDRPVTRGIPVHAAKEMIELGYERYMREHIRDTFFTPMGLRSTSYCGETAPPPRGYSVSAGGLVTLDSVAHPSLLYAAGGICSTASDLVRWNTVTFGCALGVEQEGVVHAVPSLYDRIAVGDGQSVDDWPCDLLRRELARPVRITGLTPGALVKRRRARSIDRAARAEHDPCFGSDVFEEQRGAFDVRAKQRGHRIAAQRRCVALR